MRLSILLASAVATLVASPAVAQQDKADLRPLPATLTSPVLERFSGDAEFRSYLRRVKREAKKRDVWWAGLDGPIRLAQSQTVPCTDPDPEKCPQSDEMVVVTGSKVQAPKSITNNQEAGVDEGDIVKQIGQYLLVLQDGRIFVVDTRAPQGLALVDRANVYREADSDVWYDEMLVQDRHVLITAYSYEEDATEVSVFGLGADGKLSREGVFLISSDDYYSVDNYATRIVGENLVFYTPMRLTRIDPDRPFSWPVIRRWMPEAERDAAIAKGKRLFDAATIYKPVQPTIDPAIHSISVCPIGPIGKGRDMACRSTAIVGPSEREYYVTPTDVYLWLSPGWSEYEGNRFYPAPCDQWNRRAPADAHPAGLYRIPVSGAEPSALKTRGVPVDQFSFQVSNGRMHALLGWIPIECGAEPKEENEEYERTKKLTLRYLDVSLAALSDTPAEAPRSAYAPLPGVTAGVQNRYTDRYLVYAGPSTRYPRPPLDDDDDAPEPATIVAVPIRDPGKALSMPVAHSVIRMERIGDDIITTGYRDRVGLSLSVVDLSGAPRLGPTALLPDRFESEGRSHAFNSQIEPDGHGLFGIPTRKRGADEDWWWNSEGSDVSFFALDRARRIASIGELSATPEEKRAETSYECEVSCVDWYGNSRPIFTDGRVFALSETELVEGRVEGARIVEVRRLNLTQALSGDKAPAANVATPGHDGAADASGTQLVK